MALPAVPKLGSSKPLGLRAHGEVFVAGRGALGAPRHHNPAVGLERHGRRPIGIIQPKVEGDGGLAGSAEARVEQTVGVEACHGEVFVAGRASGGSRHHDLAVGLERHGRRRIVIIPPEVEGDGGLAGSAEAHVGRAVGIEARHGEVVVAGRGVLGCPHYHDLAVGLERHSRRPIVTSPRSVEGDGGLAESAETRVERAAVKQSSALE